MALAFDPNLTFFRGIKQVKTNTYPFIEKERGKGLREGSRKKAGKLQPIEVSISETIGGYEPIGVKC